MITTIEVTGLSHGKGGYAIIEFPLSSPELPVLPAVTIQYMGTDQHKALATLAMWRNQYRYQPQQPTHKQLVTLSQGPRSEIVTNPYTGQRSTLSWE